MKTCLIEQCIILCYAYAMDKPRDDQGLLEEMIENKREPHKNNCQNTLWGGVNTHNFGGQKFFF